MKALHNPFVWQGLIAVVLLVGLISDHPTIAAVVPFAVVAALLYIGWRVARLLLARAPARHGCRSPDRAPCEFRKSRVRSRPLRPTSQSIPIDMTHYLSSRVIGQDSWRDSSPAASTGAWPRSGAASRCSRRC